MKLMYTGLDGEYVSGHVQEIVKGRKYTLCEENGLPRVIEMWAPSGLRIPYYFDTVEIDGDDVYGVSSVNYSPRTKVGSRAMVH